MNSWEIIRKELTKDTKPGTMGRMIALNLCSDLFIKLLAKLNDIYEATITLDADEEMREALLKWKSIEESERQG